MDNYNLYCILKILIFNIFIARINLFIGWIYSSNDYERVAPVGKWFLLTSIAWLKKNSTHPSITLSGYNARQLLIIIENIV